MVEAWERQKGESSKYFSWFTVYRDLGPQRTLPKVIEKIEKIEKIGKEDDADSKQPQTTNNIESLIPLPTLSQLKNASKRWHWSKRGRRYDNYLDQLRRDAKEQEYVQVEERLISLGNKFIENLEKNLEELEYDYENKVTSKSHALKSAGSAYDNATKNIRLLYGRSTENKNANVEASVDQEVDVQQEVKMLTDDDFLNKELEFMKDLLDDNSSKRRK